MAQNHSGLAEQGGGVAGGGQESRAAQGTAGSAPSARPSQVQPPAPFAGRLPAPTPGSRREAVQAECTDTPWPPRRL